MKVSITDNNIKGSITGQMNHRFNNGKLVLSVDGNSDGLYSVTFPFLSSKGLAVTYYICSAFQDDWIGNGSAEEMFNNGIDIQCHSKTHTRFTVLEDYEIRSELEDQDTAFIGGGIPAANHHAYPYGTSDHTVKAIVSQYRLTGRKYQEIPADYASFYRDVDKFEIPGNKIDQSILANEVYMDIIKEKLRLAQNNKAALSMMWHTNTEEGISLLEELIDYAISLNMDIITISELYPLLWRTYLVAFKLVNQNGKGVIFATISIGDDILVSDHNGYITFIRGNGNYNFEITRDNFNNYSGNVEVNGSNVFLEIEMEQIYVDPFLGEEFEGGYIAYIFENGDYGYVAGEQRGIIMAKEDQNSSDSMQWGCRGTAIGTTSHDIGYGQDNTDDIVTFHSGWTEDGGWGQGIGIGGVDDICHEDNDGEVVAILANDLILEGYNDWFLPSLDELQKIHDNMFLYDFGDLHNGNYWSSSESNAEKAWCFHMSLNLKQTGNKTWISPKIRCCRLLKRRIADYEPIGDIENISDDVIFYDGAFYVPYDVTTFTFDDDEVGVTANYVAGEWNFT